jgi:Flp pilus assembly protein TadG
VEFAFVLPVFLLFLFAIFEFGHVLMVTNVLNSAAKDAAHFGSFDGVTTADVLDRIESRYSEAFAPGNATVYVKDASIFEDSGTDAGDVEISSLPDINIENAESRQLFVVRVEVPYEQISLLPPFWTRGLTLTGESVMRRE